MKLTILCQSHQQLFFQRSFVVFAFVAFSLIVVPRHPVVIPTVPPALPRCLSAYFENPDGICSPEICSEAGIVLTPEALASTVVTTGGKLSASSTRLQLGHSVVSAIAKNHQTPGT
jgi:ABC-type uncharacterized transport system YnjBCD permease subunit